jgi:hypothetical protein
VRCRPALWDGSLDVIRRMKFENVRGARRSLWAAASFVTAVSLVAALGLVGTVVLGCADKGVTVNTTALPTEAALMQIEVAKTDLKTKLTDPQASTLYPGLDVLEPQVGPADGWIDIAAAELEKPATQGTLFLTEAALYFADLSGQVKVTLSFGSLKSVNSEDLTVSVTVSDQNMTYDVALLHVVSPAGTTTFMVTRDASAKFKAWMDVLEALAEEK